MHSGVLVRATILKSQNYCVLSVYAVLIKWFHCEAVAIIKILHVRVKLILLRNVKIQNKKSMFLFLLP